MVMKQLLLFICSTVMAVTSLGVKRPASGDNRAIQEGWQQPYTPTRLEWLLVKLTPDDKTCVFRRDYTGVYRWSQANDDELQLTVASHRDDLKYCASLAFEELQVESSRLQLNPPILKLRHFDQGSATDRFWQCSVPARTDKNSFVDFERVCTLVINQ